MYGEDSFAGEAEAGAWEFSQTIGPEKAMDKATAGLGVDRYFGMVSAPRRRLRRARPGTTAAIRPGRLRHPHRRPDGLNRPTPGRTFATPATAARRPRG